MPSVQEQYGKRLVLFVPKTFFRRSWGKWLEYLLKHALLTVLAQKNVPVSLVSVQRILHEEGYRTGLVDRLEDPAFGGSGRSTSAAFASRRSSS